MISFSKLRMPYREDSLFAWLFLTALFIPLAFDLYNFEGFEIIKFGLVLIFIGAGLFIFFKRYWNLKGAAVINLRLDRKLFWGLGLFLGWAFLVSILALDKNYAFFGFYPRMTNGFLFFTAWVGLIFLLSAINSRQLWSLLKILFFCAFLIGFWGLLQSIGIGYYGGLTSDFFSRAAPSFLGNPNFSSMFVASVLPLGLYFFLRAKALKIKIYYGAAIFIQLWSVIIFSSRGAMGALVLGLGVCLAIGLIIKSRDRLNFSLLAGGSLILFLVLSSLFLNFARPGTVESTISLKDSNIHERLGAWDLSIASIVNRPLVGYGLGNFELVFEKNRNLTSVKTGFFDDPHNLFIYFAVGGGLPFLLLFLFLLFYPARQAFRHLRGENEDLNLQTVALLGSLAAWLGAAFFTPVAIPCYILLAFLISGFFSQSREFKIAPARSSIVFTSIGLLVSCLLAVFGVSFIAAEHLFSASINSYNNHNYVQSHRLVQIAIKLNPTNNLYYQYLAGSAIRANLSNESVNRAILEFSQFHVGRSFTYVELANIYYLLLYQKHDFSYKPVILENLQKAIDLDPFSANNYYSLAQYEFVFGDFDNAEVALKKGLALSPKNLEGIMFLAKIYQYQNNRELLIFSLKQAAEVSPDNHNLSELIKLAQTVPDIQNLPFKINLSVGNLN